MSKAFSVSLKAGERIFVNGAVLRADRKVVLEFLNDVAFLLEQHVMDVDETTTPCRQLYFIVQTMLMDPQNAEVTKALFDASFGLLVGAVETRALKDGLGEVLQFVENGRFFDALKALRGLFAIEDAIIAQGGAAISPLKFDSPRSPRKEITACK